MGWAAWLACSSTLVVLPANAQEAAPAVATVLVVDGASPRFGERVAAALHAELGAPVRVARAANAGETEVRLRIARSSAQLEVIRPGGVAITRSVELPEDPEQRVRVLVVVMSNLARDQLRDLIAAPTASASDGPTGAPSPSPAAPRAQTSGSASADGDLPPWSPPPSATPAPTTASATTTSAAQPDDPWRHRLFRLGLGAHLGGAITPDGNGGTWFLLGLEFLFAPTEWIAFGLRNVSPSFAGDFGVLFAPVVELSWRLSRRWDLHAALALNFHAVARTTGSNFEAAAQLGVGARWYAVPVFSIAADLTSGLVLTDTFETWSDVLAQRSVPIAFALSFAWHL